MRMPFGQYKDQEIQDIPIDYLKWVDEHKELKMDYRLRWAIRDRIEYVTRCEYQSDQICFITGTVWQDMEDKYGDDPKVMAAIDEFYNALKVEFRAQFG